MNNVSLIGRLTKDPSFKYSPNGIPVSRFTIAVNRPYVDKQGERKADFISCVAWRKQAENIANYMKKGNLIGVTGRIMTSSYEEDGRKIYRTNVVADSIDFLEKKSNNIPETIQEDTTLEELPDDLPF